MAKAKLWWRNREWSIVEIAVMYRMKQRTVGRRIRELEKVGVPTEEAIELSISIPMDRMERIEIDGEVRSTLDWMNKAGIARATFYRRRKKGLTGDKLISPPKKRQGGLTAFGKTQSYRAWQRERGIPAGTIWGRVDSGLSPELAVTIPPDNRMGRK